MGTGAVSERTPVVERVVTDAAETFLWRLDDYPWVRNVWNVHPEYEIHLVRNASGVALVGDHIERFEPGYLAMVGSGLPHDWVTPLRVGEHIAGRDIVLQFDPVRLREAATVFPEIAALEPLLKSALRGLAFHGETRRLGATLLEKMANARGIERLGLFLHLLQVMAERGEYRVLSSPDFVPAHDDAAQDAIQRIRAQLLDNFMKELRLPDFAAQLGMTQSTFSRFFKKNTGHSFTDYVTALRIGFAAKLLADTDLPVTDICFEAGYRNLSNFNRIFRQQRGMTPTAYRRLSRQRLMHRPHAVMSVGDAPLHEDSRINPHAAAQHA